MSSDHPSQSSVEEASEIIFFEVYNQCESFVNELIEDIRDRQLPMMEENTGAVLEDMVTYLHNKIYADYEYDLKSGGNNPSELYRLACEIDEDCVNNEEVKDKKDDTKEDHLSKQSKFAYT